MYYVYTLKSLRDGKLYTGKTSDLKKRLEKHYNGEVPATRRRRPLKLIYYEAFENKTDCGAEELFLKSGIGRESLKHRLKNSLRGGIA